MAIQTFLRGLSFYRSEVKRHKSDMLLDGSAAYLVYTALLSQSAEYVLTTTKLEDTLTDGVDFVEESGYYRLYTGVPFNADRVHISGATNGDTVIANPIWNSGQIIGYYQIYAYNIGGNLVIEMDIFDNEENSLSFYDAFGTVGFSFPEIRVYP